ncbi:DUF4145 domain-containing protein [Sphingomonas mesophila]|uniref:DUF4145 domain-containing protein n=1 Tax=Sphingomonas mesophila TaxID=2303576 RepID=UPI000E592DDC|nr:DUF4145 domain-containing protein [Sphingomonas mesophila]
MAFNWVCPYCNHAQTVVSERTSRTTGPVGVQDVAEGSLVLQRRSIGCANPDCHRLTLEVIIGQDAGGENWRLKPNTEIFRQTLLPRGTAKPQPDYIPAPLVEDYTEACLISDLSPKASATLARRCLQGMIRNFCNIQKPRLIDEITELRVQVESGVADRSISPESVEAIDNVRSIGNIGAHMEKDINTIVPVDADEAVLLIGLIELLFAEWYGARHARKVRLEKIALLKFQKDALKAQQAT